VTEFSPLRRVVCLCNRDLGEPI